MKHLFILLSVFGISSPLWGEELPKNISVQCDAPPIPTPIVCEAGGKFLCVNSAPGGVKEGFVILKGRLNLEQATLGQFGVSTQHEYTKKIKTISISKIAGNDCWEEPILRDGQLCLQNDGTYSVRVPLEEVGPYTLFVTATKLAGAPMQTTVRVSRVIAPTVTEEVISYEPQGTHHTKVILDLLKGCGEAKEACDFIGASTGGVQVTIANTMTGPPQKKVSCETTTMLGGAGRFVIGVPVQPGKNQMVLHICNAATGFDLSGCPKMVSPIFDVGGEIPKIEILNPLARGPFYWDSDSSLGVPLRFRIKGLLPTACTGEVTVVFNDGKSFPVCPNGEGVYETILQPVYGYNVAAIEATLNGTTWKHAVPFGWGKAISPFTPQGELKPTKEWTLKKALQFWIPKKIINEVLLPRLHVFLNSDEFKKSVSDVAEGIGRGPSTGNGSEEKKGRFPSYCPASNGDSFKIRVSDPPKWDEITLRPLSFEAGSLKIAVAFKNVSIGIQIYKDENGDQKPDLDPLPIRIVFKTLSLRPQIQSNGSIQLSSPYTDCDYKREGLCRHMPALIIPKNFKGGASRAGAFAVCDWTQRISKKMEEICDALNTIDRQTGGVFEEKVLDTINTAYSCEGNRFLQSFLSNGFPLNQEVGPLAIVGKLMVGKLGIEEGGLFFSVDTRFGDENIFKLWDPSVRQRGAGILVGNAETLDLAHSKEGPIGMSLHLPLLSQLFWGLSDKEGHRQFVIDEALFKNAGFDFAKECVAKEIEKEETDEEPERKNPLCNVWPRAREILGGEISEYGYLAPTAPLRILVVPSTAFPLRVSALDSHGKMAIETLDWELQMESGDLKIITALLSMKLVAYISPAMVLPQHPDALMMSIRLDGEKSKIWITEKEGSNATVVPSDVLLSSLLAKFQFAINQYSKPETEIKLHFPRFLLLAPDSIFSKLGLQELTWTQGGLQMQLEDSSDQLFLQLQPVLR